MVALVSAATAVLVSACGVLPGSTTSAVPGPAGTAPRTTSATPTPSVTPSASTDPTPSPWPTVPPRPAGQPGPLGSTGTWKLDFRDEFSGRTVDLDHWRPNWLTNADDLVSKPINRAEKGCYDPANVTVAKGTLRLTAEKRACRTHVGQTYAYATGAVESAHDYRFTYGFAEARIYLPPADGTLAPAGSCGPNWGVFMLNGKRHPQDGEIDVMECLSENAVAWHYHWGTDDDRHNVSGYPAEWSGDMPGTSGWHTFGVDWEPGRLTFYFDGVVVGVQEEAVTSSPHYLVLAQALSGTAVAAPQTMKVDWVRVWKRSPSKVSGR